MSKDDANPKRCRERPMLLGWSNHQPALLGVPNPVPGPFAEAVVDAELDKMGVVLETTPNGASFFTQVNDHT